MTREQYRHIVLLPFGMNRDGCLKPSHQTNFSMGGDHAPVAPRQRRAGSIHLVHALSLCQRNVPRS